MFLSLRKSNPKNEPIFLHEGVLSEHPPVTRTRFDEDGYEVTERVRDAIATSTMVHIKVHNPEGAPVLRLYGTQGFDDKNGDPKKVLERHDMWAHGTGSLSSSWS